MNANRSLLPLAMSALLLAGCMSGGQVMSDSDPRADFSRYHTFAFSDRLGTNRGDNADSLLSQRLKSATAREMQARGFSYDPRSPDLLFDFHAKVEDRVYSTTMFTPMFGYYSYRGGFYGGWPMWNYDLGTDHYREGRLNIDLIDAAQKRVVWETVVLGDAARATGPRATGIVDVAIAKAFRRFPVPVPVAMPANN